MKRCQFKQTLYKYIKNKKIRCVFRPIVNSTVKF